MGTSANVPRAPSSSFISPKVLHHMKPSSVSVKALRAGAPPPMFPVIPILNFIRWFISSLFPPINISKIPNGMTSTWGIKISSSVNQHVATDSVSHSPHPPPPPLRKSEFAFYLFSSIDITSERIFPPHTHLIIRKVWMYKASPIASLAQSACVDASWFPTGILATCARLFRTLSNSSRLRGSSATSQVVPPSGSRVILFVEKHRCAQISLEFVSIYDSVGNFTLVLSLELQFANYLYNAVYFN